MTDVTLHTKHRDGRSNKKSVMRARMKTGGTRERRSNSGKEGKNIKKKRQRKREEEKKNETGKYR